MDGLRGICIAAVMVFHFTYSHTGGALGVDVFFVLSGYLITRLLLEREGRAGRIDFADFYGRRARRLLPAMVLGCALATAMWPIVNAGDRLAAMWSAAVGYYMDLAVVYHWPGSLAMPQFWSLAVEEQFYLVWPVTLALLLSMCRRHLSVAIASMVLANVALRLWLYRLGSPLATYYSPVTRADELLAGCFAASLHTGPNGLTVERLARAAAPAAFGAIVSMLVFAPSRSDAYLAGGSALFAAVAAIPIVHAASSDASVVNRVLSCRPLVWLGKRSYGLYVYHWPILNAFGPLRHHGLWNFAWVTALRVVVSLVVADLSYRFVESIVMRAASERISASTPTAA